MGGNNRDLYEWLIKTEFSIDKLSECELLAGDSAGAYALGEYMMIDNQPDGNKFKAEKGFVPGSNMIFAAHVNNSKYHREGLTHALEKFAKDKEIELRLLQENELFEGVRSHNKFKSITLEPACKNLTRCNWGLAVLCRQSTLLT